MLVSTVSAKVVLIRLVNKYITIKSDVTTIIRKVTDLTIDRCSVSLYFIYQ